MTKKFLANMKDEILDFCFTSFNLNSCQMPLITTSHVWESSATAIALSVSSELKGESL